ncbi:hypothetical protein CSB69_3656 [Morganella morganii]|nr:hypothetical protein CSB69_3656 [Morganella morganii]EMP52559.1 hypothetical protein C790_03532 [Morganella morganii SC01]ETO43278.1 hypothetical protein X965_17005 [Morganella sp. EGD-HP17]
MYLYPIFVVIIMIFIGLLLIFMSRQIFGFRGIYWHAEYRIPVL